MHSMFPCPNPVCTHKFSPEAVKGASSLVCPRCGTVFQFGSPPAAPSRSSTSGKKPAPPSVKPPVAPPRIPPRAAVPIAQPVSAGKGPPAPASGAEPSSAALNFNSTPELVMPRGRRKAQKTAKGGVLSWIAFVVVGVLGPTAVVWGGIWLFFYLKSSFTEQEAGRIAEVYNSRFNWPDKPWTRDTDLQMRLHVHIGMIARTRNSGMALLFKDYKDRMPSDAEMLDDALGKLRSYFRGLEWELKSPDTKPRLAGRPAQVLEFQGVDADEVTMNGECYMTAFRGYGYWFFTWVPLGEREINRESIQTEWRQLRQRLTLLDGRKGWTERPPESEKIAGKKATYQLAYVKELWTREPADNYDPPVDLVLKGHEPDPERRPLAGKDATVQVLVLPKQANLKAAAAAARDHVKQRERKLYERTTLEPMKDKHGAEIDRAADIGTEHGHLSKFRMKNTEDLERYLLIAVVNRPEGVVAIVGDCLWERHDFWDQEMMALLKTFKVKDR